MNDSAGTPEKRGPAMKTWARHLASLRVRLLLLVVLAFVPGVILTVYSVAQQRHNAEEVVMVTAPRLVRLATANQDQLVEAPANCLAPVLPSLPCHTRIHKAVTRSSKNCSRSTLCMRISGW